MKPFPLINVIKYAKGHYKRTGDYWLDIARCLHADGYDKFWGLAYMTPEAECFYQRNHLVNIIVNKLRPYIKDFRLEQIINHASPNFCWQINYYCKGNSMQLEKDLPDYDYWKAILMAYLSEAIDMVCEDLGYANWDLFTKDNIPELKKDPEPEIII